MIFPYHAVPTEEEMFFISRSLQQPHFVIVVEFYAIFYQPANDGVSCQLFGAIDILTKGPQAEIHIAGL